jgi:hypothetical protein
MQFYVVFPFIYLAMKRFGAGKTAVVLALFSYAFMWMFNQAVAAGKAHFFFEPSMLFFKLPIFLTGILIYRAASTSTTSNWHRATYVLGLADECEAGRYLPEPSDLSRCIGCINGRHGGAISSYRTPLKCT